MYNLCCKNTLPPSFFLGKSESAIKTKLLQLYNKQKANEKTPFFSSLLKSRAALLHPPDPKSRDKAPTMPLSEPNFFGTPSQSGQSTDARVNFVSQTIKVEAPSPPAALPARSSAAASPSDLQGSKADQAAAPALFTVVKSQKDSEHKGPALVVGNESADKKPLVALVPKPHQNVTLPLIRSKTGRIILPSSLKPRKLRVDVFMFNVVLFNAY